MSELKAGVIVTPHDEGMCFDRGSDVMAVTERETEFYLKSEADKVIAELKEKYNELAKLHDKAIQACCDADKEIAHNKFKRCLAMARWCEATALWCYQAANTLPAGFHATLYGKPVMIEPDRLFNRHVLLTKWHARWLELAEKFKPNSTLQQKD